MSPTSGVIPPALTPAEQELEQRLLPKVHQDYRHLEWWEKTKSFCDAWDHLRRSRLGLLETYFPQFKKRWEYSEWRDFNEARRMADLYGARYEEWVRVQFEAASDDGELRPHDLHGLGASEAYKHSRHPGANPVPTEGLEPGPAPPSRPAGELDPLVKHRLLRALSSLKKEQDRLRQDNLTLSQSNAFLQKASLVDELTHLPNRRHLDDLLAREWRRARREKAPLSLVVVEIRDLLGYRRHFGSEQASACLVQVAQALHNSVLRPGDRVARLGEHSFAALLPGTDREGAVLLARRMIRAVRALDLVHPTLGSGRVEIDLSLKEAHPQEEGDGQELLSPQDLELLIQNPTT